MFKTFLTTKPSVAPDPEESKAPNTSVKPEEPKSPAVVPSIQKQEPTKRTEAVMPEIASKNILSNDVEIKGSIKFLNELIVDGKVDGEISSEAGNLTVGENAEVKGEIRTKSVTVLGRVNGNITVAERCELKSRAQLIGDLKAARLVIEEGATFVGKSEVTPNKVAMKQPEIVRGDSNITPLKTGTGGK